MLAKSSNDCRVFKIKVENLDSMKVSKTVMRYHPWGNCYIQKAKLKPLHVWLLPLLRRLKVNTLNQWQGTKFTLLLADYRNTEYKMLNSSPKTRNLPKKTLSATKAFSRFPRPRIFTVSTSAHLVVKKFLGSCKIQICYSCALQCPAYTRSMSLQRSFVSSVNFFFFRKRIQNIPYRRAHKHFCVTAQVFQICLAETRKQLSYAN